MIKIKCLKELGEIEADTVKCNQDKEKRKRNNAIREKDDSLGESWRDRGAEWRRGNRDEGERARREQTLMPPCRPQMLHQLQTSSFLRSPSFPSSRPPQIEKERERERQGDICRIQTYYVPSHSLSSSLRPSAPIFSLSPFRRLSTRPRGDDIGYTEGDTWQTQQRRRSSTRHEFSIKFNTGRKRTPGCCTLLFQVIEQSEGQRKKQRGEKGKAWMGIENAVYTAVADIILGSSSLEHYQFRRVSIHEILMLHGSLLPKSTPVPSSLSLSLPLSLSLSLSFSLLSIHLSFLLLHITTTHVCLLRTSLQLPLCYLYVYSIILFILHTRFSLNFFDNHFRVLIF